MGVESALLTGGALSECVRLVPELDLTGIEVALYTPRDGNIDAHSIMMAYAAAARRRGAAIVEGVRAVGLRMAGGRVTGVETTAGPIATPIAVNAAGFGGREVAAWAGLRLPIANLKRHIFVTGPVPAYNRLIPFTYEVDAAWYMRREGPGLIVGMGASPSDEEDPQVDWGFLEAVIEQSIRRAPALADAGVKGGWAGLRSVTPDDLPILGPVPHLAGYYNDCGWGGHGVMHAPAAGEALAETIVRGRAAVNLGPFKVERFDDWRW